MSQADAMEESLRRARDIERRWRRGGFPDRRYRWEGSRRRPGRGPHATEFAVPRSSCPPADSRDGRPVRRAQRGLTGRRTAAAASLVAVDGNADDRGHVTPGELTEIEAEIMQTLQRYERHDPNDRPPEARPVSMIVFAAADVDEFEELEDEGPTA